MKKLFGLLVAALSLATPAFAHGHGGHCGGFGGGGFPSGGFHGGGFYGSGHSMCHTMHMTRSYSRPHHFHFARTGTFGSSSGLGNFWHLRHHYNMSSYPAMNNGTMAPNALGTNGYGQMPVVPQQPWPDPTLLQQLPANNMYGIPPVPGAMYNGR